MIKKDGRGGARNGAGRPPLSDKRVNRGLTFNSVEWELIRGTAKKHGLSVRAYLCSLVEKYGR